MATSKAFKLFILLVVAVCVTQCTGKPDDSKTSKNSAEEAWTKLMNARAKLSPDKVLKLLKTVTNSKNLRDKELGHGLMVQEAYYYVTDHSCDSSAMLEFNKYYLQADLFSTPIKNFLIYYYEKQIKNCEQMARLGLEFFRNKKPASWRQLRELFNAIKSDDKLYADLDGNSGGMNEEMMNLLGDVLRKKQPGADAADYQSQAIRKIRDICKNLRKTLRLSGLFSLLDSLLVVKKLSSSVKRQGDLPEHIRYLYLCKQAKETVLPDEAEKIKLNKEYKSEMKRLRQEYRARAKRLGQAQSDDVKLLNKN